jgi:hypothetical protein
MKVLVVCRPAVGVDPSVQFGEYLEAELEELRSLSRRGILTEAYSPGAPGAVLILSVPDLGAAEACTRSLPLAQAQLIEVELFPLYTIPL